MDALPGRLNPNPPLSRLDGRGGGGGAGKRHILEQKNVNGILLGSVYAFFAVGLSMVFRIL
jgi:hypothetical protein